MSVRSFRRVLAGLATLALILVPMTLSAQAKDLKVISYIRTWPLGSTTAEFDQGVHWSASQIRGDLLSSLDVAFATIVNKTDIAFTDMQDQPAKSDPSKSVAGFKSLPDENAKLAKKYPKLVINVSIGGWGAEGFPFVAGSADARKAFAANVAAFVKKNNFSGVDIDWEYPTGDPDSKNYVLMMAELRTALDGLGQALGRRINLTCAVPAGGDFVNEIDVVKLAQIVDYFKIMSYDYFGSWTETTGHASGLFANPNDPQGLATADVVQAYLDASVPANKLVLGIPFYGRAWDNVPAGPDKKLPGLYQAHGDSLWDDGLAYADIAAKVGKDGFVRYWDDVAQAPYLYNGRVFITYEDQQSIAARVKFAKDQGLAGVMIWEYGHDMDSKLLTGLNQAIAGK